jgi:small GTP-binding protein
MFQNEEDVDSEEIKIILIGDSGVGKTNLINTCVGLDFNESENPTITGYFNSKTMEVNDRTYSLNLWDTAGQESYRGLTQLFFRGAELVILVYDITSRKTFESLDEWYEISEDTINNEHIYGIVGNKNDLFVKAEITEEEGDNYAKSKKAKFKLVSAKETPESFVKFVEELVMDYKKIDINNRRKSVKLNKVKKDKEHNSKIKDKCIKCKNS